MKEAPEGCRQEEQRKSNPETIGQSSPAEILVWQGLLAPKKSQK